VATKGPRGRSRHEKSPAKKSEEQTLTDNGSARSARTKSTTSLRSSIAPHGLEQGRRVGQQVRSGAETGIQILFFTAAHMTGATAPSTTRRRAWAHDCSLWARAAAAACWGLGILRQCAQRCVAAKEACSGRRTSTASTTR